MRHLLCYWRTNPKRRRATLAGLVARCSALTLLALVSAELHAIDIWLSPSYKTGDGSTQPANVGELPSVNRDQGATGTLFIWGTPDAAKTLANWSVNIVSSNQAALRFTSAQVGDYNPVLVPAAGMQPAKRRWEFMGQPQPLDMLQGDAQLNTIAGFSIFDLMHEGIGIGTGPAAAGGGVTDPFAVGGAWLLASVDYVTGGSPASVDVSLQIGGIGINHLGESTAAAQVRFGHATDNLLNGTTDRSISSNHPELTIAVSNLGSAPGDYNRDGAIDMQDYARWRYEYGNALTPGNGADGDGNGVVNASDYAIWRENLPPPGAVHLLETASPVAVPEPCCAWLLACVWLVATSGSRRCMKRGNRSGYVVPPGTLQG